MPRIEIFFDYACPYCMRAHAYLVELLPQYPDVEAAWRPCESHPRPERYGPHSDLCIQGLFYAQDHGADIAAYHEAAYAAALRERIDVEDINVLAARMAPLLDAGDFKAQVNAGRYRTRLREANDYAYGKSGVWVVPAYRMDGRRLDVREDVGVTKAQLERFLRGTR